MGTTCSYKPPGQPLVDFFVEHGVLRWSNENPRAYRVLDTALVKLSEFYVALEVVEKATGKRDVVALVIKVKMFREDASGFNFCWRDMDESMGPTATNCPERILKLLTLTDNAYALEWRRACWEKITKRKLVPPLKKDVVLNFRTPVPFSSGKQDKLVITAVRGQRIDCTDPNGWGWFRLTRSWINQQAAAGELSFS